MSWSVILNHLKINPLWIIASIVVAVVTYFIFRKRVDERQKLMVAALTLYCCLILSFLVFGRHATGVFKYQLIPFWSYRWMVIYPNVIEAAIMNILIYIPFGIMIPVFTKNYRKAIGIGILISLTVNFLQLVTTVGSFEFDDIFHNTLGVIIGCVCCHYIRKYYWKQKSLKKNKT